MDANSLADVYRTYKRGTTKVATWLVETAKALDVELPKKKAPSPTSKTTTTPASMKCIVCCSDFVRLTKAIANTSASISLIQPTIIQTLKDVISARKQCALWYGGLHNEDTVKSYETHGYFIGQLEMVLQILQDSLKKDTPQEKQGKKTIDKQLNMLTQSTADRELPQFTNQFAHLTVEEPLATPEPVASPATPSQKSLWKKKKKNAAPVETVVYELKENTEGEFSLAALFYASQWAEVYTFAKGGWTEFSQAQVGLTSISLTTNMGVDLLRRTEADIVAAFHPEMSRREITSKLISCLSTVKEINGTALNGKSNAMIYDLLKALLEDFGEEHLPNLETFQHPAFTLERGLFEMKANANGKFESIELLSNVMINTRLLHIANGWIPMADESVRGLQVLFKDKLVEAWMVLAWRLVLVSYNALGAKRPRAAQVLRQESECALDWIREYLRFDWGRVCCMHKSCLDLCCSVVSLVAGYVKNDPVSKAKDKIFGRKTGRVPSNYLASHPILCGTLTFGILYAPRECARRVSNDRRLLIEVAHLYNAVKQCELVTRDWEDLEQLIFFYTEQQFFLGARPTARENFYKRLTLVHGGSIANWTQDGMHRHQYVQQGSRDRGMQMLSDTQGWEVATYRWFIAPDPENTFRPVPDSLKDFDMEKLLWKSRNSGADWTMGEDSGSTQKFLSTHLFFHTLTEIDLHFDCLAMIRKSVRLLAEIREDLAKKELTELEDWPSPTRDCRGPKDVKVEGVAQLVGLILYADSVCHACPFPKKGGCNCKVVSKSGGNCLKDAAARFQALIDEQGSKEIEAAEASLERVQDLIANRSCPSGGVLLG